MIWDALKAAAGSDTETARLICESAGIIVGPPNMTICYDERGEQHPCAAERQTDTQFTGPSERLAHGNMSCV